MEHAPDPELASLEACNTWAERRCIKRRDMIMFIERLLASAPMHAEIAVIYVGIVRHVMSELKALAEYVDLCSDYIREPGEEVERSIDIRYRSIHLSNRCERIVARHP